MTHTRTHVVEHFANPHLICDFCKQPVTAFHDSENYCGCDEGFWNEPCEHLNAGVTSTCPSWNPVDGCTCQPPHTAPKTGTR